MSVRRILWETSRHSITFRSYCRIEVMNPGHNSNLGGESTESEEEGDDESEGDRGTVSERERERDRQRGTEEVSEERCDSFELTCAERWWWTGRGCRNGDQFASCSACQESLN